MPGLIAIDGRYINDRYHGIGRYAFHLLEALVAESEKRARRFRFVVFRGREDDSRFNWSWLASRPCVEIKSGPGPLFWPKEQLQWSALLKRHNVELFFSPYFVAPLFTGIPVVITVHDLIFDRYPEFMPNRWAHPYYRLLMSLSARRSRRIVAVSQATASDLIHFYPVPIEKIAVVHEAAVPGFAPPAYETHLVRIKQRYSLDEPYILFVGTRRPHKNLANLVRAFAGLDTSLGHQLVFAGQADKRFPDEARMVAQSLGLDRHVRFLGWVPEADLPGLYSLASVLAMPSTIEGFGLPAIEAMACGTPVLAANTSSLPEVVGTAGLLVDANDPQALLAGMHELLSDQDLHNRLRKASLTRAATFTWEKAARVIIEIFDDLLT